jgi:predicted AlkP superfamily phosphohydrolase/phosphomutase
MKKVIVIGLDGMEPTIVETMFRSGELPNLARINELGRYARLQTTYPAQTPVAWSTFATGTNPGGHGIFDFLSRDVKTYLPQLALSRYEQKNAFVPPKVVNNRRGKAIWDVLTQSGIPSTVLRCPCTYPPGEIKGRVLAGVGVPDLRGGLGTSTFYTTRMDVVAEASEKVILVFPEKEFIHTILIGPRDPKSHNDLTFEITIKIDRQNQKVIINSAGQPESFEVSEGQWSNWLHVKFKSGLLQAVHGMVRFYLKQVEPFELYASPLNFDPAAPLFPISFPNEYAAEIQTRLGSFYTAGMPEDHDGLIYGRFDEIAFLDQCEIVVRERRKLLLAELNRFKEGFFYCLFDTPDRLAHMFWRFRQPDHPANYVNGVNAEHCFRRDYSQAIEEHYRRLDAILGEVWKFIDEETLFMVLSDHGMNTFDRGLNLNTWLYENGYLALKKGIEPGDDKDDSFFRNVDWDRTKAYALALGGIFINLKGREANGIISANEAEKVKANIIQGLTGLCDEKRNQVAVRSVFTREQLYTGPYVSEAADLLVNFSPGYRVSWGTPLGGVPAGLFEDNVKRWGGDHVIDPGVIPGIFFTNKPFKKQLPNMTDMAPTILAALGVSKLPVMEGENLLT